MELIPLMEIPGIKLVCVVAVNTVKKICCIYLLIMLNKHICIDAKSLDSCIAF